MPLEKNLFLAAPDPTLKLWKSPNVQSYNLNVNHLKQILNDPDSQLKVLEPREIKIGFLGFILMLVCMKDLSLEKHFQFVGFLSKKAYNKLYSVDKVLCWIEFK